MAPEMCHRVREYQGFSCACIQAKLAQEAMLALESGADGGMRQALRQAPDIILPPMQSLHLP